MALASLFTNAQLALRPLSAVLLVLPLLIGAGWALFLGWWLDLRKLPPSSFLPEADGGEPTVKPINATREL